MRRLSKIQESLFSDVVSRGEGRSFRGEDMEFVNTVKEFTQGHNIKDTDYRINTTDKCVDFFTSVRVSKEDLVDGILPFKFGTVQGRCYMCDLGLNTLENALTKVDGDFVIYDNNLHNFIGGPEEVSGDFAANVNRSLESLDGSPKKVGGNYSIRFTLHLKDVSGITPDIGGKLEVSKDFSFDEDVKKYSNVKIIDKK